MAWQLCAEVWAHAPTGLSPSQRLILLYVAEQVHQRDVERRTCSMTLDQIADATGLKPASITSALTRLREDHDLDVRVPLRDTGGRHGGPLYAVAGVAPRFIVPPLPAPDGCSCRACSPIRGSAQTDPPIGGSAHAAGGSAHAAAGSIPAAGGSAHADPNQVPSTEDRDDARATDPAEPEPAVASDLARAAGHVARTFDLTPDLARAAVDAWLLDRQAAGDRVNRPAAYVESFVRAEQPGQLRKYIDRVRRADQPAPLAPAPGRPAAGRTPTMHGDLGPPCGQCDARPSTGPGLPHPPASERLVFDDHGAAVPCPRCHPTASTGRTRAAS